MMTSLARKSHSTLASKWRHLNMEGNTSICESAKGWCHSARMVSEGLHIQPSTRSCGAVPVVSISRCREVVSILSLWLPQKKPKTNQCQVRSQPACRGDMFSTLWKHLHTGLIWLSRTRSPQMSRSHFIHLNWLDTFEEGTVWSTRCVSEITTTELLNAIFAPRCMRKVFHLTLSIFNTHPSIIRCRFCAFMLNRFIHKCGDLILFIFCFYFWWRVKRPTMGSSCDIISPGEHSLLASIFPWVPTVTEAVSHLDSWL